MKKLFFLALFTIGFISISSAQFCTYTLTNSSPLNWDYKMVDAGPTPVIYELGIVPGGVRTGVISNFAFNLAFKCQNSSGCGTSQNILGPTPGVSIPIPCAPPAGVKYQVTEFVPGFLYHLELKMG